MVFHAQYLAFMERARTELLNAPGIDLARFAERDGVLFVVHQLQAIYHAAGAAQRAAFGERRSG